MALSERGSALLAAIEHDLPSRRLAASRTFAEKLDILDRLKQAADDYERTATVDLANSEKS